MQRLYLIITLSLLMGSASYAQSTATQAPERKVFFGGNLGFNLSSNYWLVHVAPLVGYRFTPAVSGGVGLIYQYESDSRQPRLEVQTYGGLVFARYDFSANLMKNMPFGLFTQADYEKTRSHIRFVDHGHLNRTRYNDHLFLGLGYIQPAGKRTRFFLLVSFDMLNLNSHPTPLIRAGVTF